MRYAQLIEEDGSIRLIRLYGTSEGAIKGWESRRGESIEPGSKEWIKKYGKRSPHDVAKGIFREKKKYFTPKEGEGSEQPLGMHMSYGEETQDTFKLDKQYLQVRSTFDIGELEKGIIIEGNEHHETLLETLNLMGKQPLAECIKFAAEGIAKDHLKEIPDYYTRLAIMEQTAENPKVGAGSSIIHNSEKQHLNKVHKIVKTKVKKVKPIRAIMHEPDGTTHLVNLFGSMASEQATEDTDSSLKDFYKEKKNRKPLNPIKEKSILQSPISMEAPRKKSGIEWVTIGKRHIPFKKIKSKT